MVKFLSNTMYSVKKPKIGQQGGRTTRDFKGHIKKKQISSVGNMVHMFEFSFFSIHRSDLFFFFEYGTRSQEFSVFLFLIDL